MTDTPTTTSVTALQAQADALLRNNEALIKATARMANQRDDALVLAPRRMGTRPEKRCPASEVRRGSEDTATPHE